MENVVRNAVHYNAEGAVVEISLAREAARAVLRIRDHGPGVPRACSRTFFLPFRARGIGAGPITAERFVRPRMNATKNPRHGRTSRWRLPGTKY